MLKCPSLRYPADSNCCTRFCRPLPSHSVRVPLLLVCECKVKTLFSFHQTFQQKISLCIKNMAGTYSKEPLFQLFTEANKSGGDKIQMQRYQKKHTRARPALDFLRCLKPSSFSHSRHTPTDSTPYSFTKPCKKQ